VISSASAGVRQGEYVAADLLRKPKWGTPPEVAGVQIIESVMDDPRSERVTEVPNGLRMTDIAIGPGYGGGANQSSREPASL
jgi:hypothetical protein